MSDRHPHSAASGRATDIATERNGAVAQVTLNRPEVHNAFRYDMWRELAVVLGELGADETIRVIVIRGAGEAAFASGADISEFSTRRSTPEQALVYHTAVESALDAVTAAPQPVVAMIHGYCVGGGCELAVACDLRLCDDRARFGIPAAKLGVVLGLQELRQLRALIGAPAAKDLLLTGRLIDAAEALRIGLVHRVVPTPDLSAAVGELASSIVANSSLAVTAVKQLLNGLDDGRPAHELEALQASLSHRAFESPDYQHALRDFLQRGARKRAPE